MAMTPSEIEHVVARAGRVSAGKTRPLMISGKDPPRPRAHSKMEPSAMAELSELIREYGDVLAQEHHLAERKERLRTAIAEEMALRNLKSTRTEYGTALRTFRFRLLPRRERVLGLLCSEDLFFFANFTPARVKEHLVPKYGRETLIPLFEIQKTELLVIKRPPGIF
jgi:hypothetical protein